MKKILGLILTVFAFVLLTAGPGSNKAEAARVAVLPLQTDNLVVDENEDTNDYSSLYWDEATDLFKFPAFELLGDDEVQKALPKEGLKDYSEATLKTMADKTESDIVIAMRLDNITSKNVFSRLERTEKTIMKGEFASYNRISGKYQHKLIDDENEVEEVLLVRGNWRAELFSKMARRYMSRAMKLK
jgi:hypothetical protein